MTLPPKTFTRRNAIGLLTLSVGGAVVLPRASIAQAISTDHLILDSDVCALVPEVTEGPYYFDPQLVRADITEGRPGLPLEIEMQIVDQMCQAFPGARVDIWHCDAGGLYSGYVNQSDAGQVSAENETFMRGTQFADDNGVVRYTTVYPGWYRGRTTHIHFKVFLDETTVLTGQIFFPDELSNQVYASVPPYSDRTQERDTLNSNDGIAQQAGTASIADLSEIANGHIARLIVGVDPNAVSSGGMGGFGRQSPRN